MATTKGTELEKTAGDKAGEIATEAKKAAKKGFAGLAQAAANATTTLEMRAILVEVCNELDKWK